MQPPNYASPKSSPLTLRGKAKRKSFYKRHKKAKEPTTNLTQSTDTAEKLDESNNILNSTLTYSQKSNDKSNSDPDDNHSYANDKKIDAGEIEATTSFPAEADTASTVSLTLRILASFENHQQRQEQHSLGGEQQRLSPLKSEGQWYRAQQPSDNNNGMIRLNNRSGIHQYPISPSIYSEQNDGGGGGGSSRHFYHNLNPQRPHHRFTTSSYSQQHQRSFTAAHQPQYYPHQQPQRRGRGSRWFRGGPGTTRPTHHWQSILDKGYEQQQQHPRNFSHHNNQQPNSQRPQLNSAPAVEFNCPRRNPSHPPHPPPGSSSFKSSIVPIAMSMTSSSSSSVRGSVACVPIVPEHPGTDQPQQPTTATATRRSENHHRTVSDTEAVPASRYRSHRSIRHYGRLFSRQTLKGVPSSTILQAPSSRTSTHVHNVRAYGAPNPLPDCPIVPTRTSRWTERSLQTPVAAQTTIGSQMSSYCTSYGSTTTSRAPAERQQQLNPSLLPVCAMGCIDPTGKVASTTKHYEEDDSRAPGDSFQMQPRTTMSMTPAVTGKLNPAAGADSLLTLPLPLSSSQQTDEFPPSSRVGAKSWVNGTSSKHAEQQQQPESLTERVRHFFSTTPLNELQQSIYSQRYFD